jgi:MoxR-like ATPase
METKHQCEDCGQHVLVEDGQTQGLACPKCGGEHFAPVPEPAAPVAEESFPAEPDVSAPAAAEEAMADEAAAGPADIERICELNRALSAELEKVIVGQKDVIEEVILAILTNAHCLLEGVPGLAKTLLISSMAKAMNLSFKRIQFTPDLMPSDITGTEVIQEDRASRERSFKFLPGPIFANIILADEINRTPPKTQAALLEAMQEKQVSVGGVVHPLPSPFFILATQNPLEQEGTYPLPEAQQDRFLFKIFVGYPQPDEEVEIVRRVSEQRFGDIQPVCDAASLLAMQKKLRDIPVSDAVVDYANRLVRATRVGQDTALDFVKEWLSWGAGPRATICLVMAAKCFCALDGRPTPACEDVARAALPTLRHRIALNYTAKAEGLSTDDVIRKLLETVEKY